MRRVFSLLLLGITACVGKALPNNAQADAAVDAPPEQVALMLTGKTVDYFGNVPLPEVVLLTDGIEPSQTVTSAPDALFEIPLLVGSKIYLVAAKPLTYRATRSTAISVAADPIVQDAYVMSVQDIKNQYTTVGATPVANTAFVVAELRRNNNTPLEVPLANIQLLDSNNQPATFKGPYAFNAAGNLDPVATTVATFGGRSRVALLDVPAGAYTLNVSYPNNNGGTQTNSTSLTAIEEGATLVLSGGSQGSGTGGVTDPSFATDIYPRLQRAAAGGLGCANCHTLTGPAAVLKYDDPPATVLTNILARVGVINATTPADSLLLKRPLYELPPAMQDHPNATFVDTNDADYKLFLLWIMNGAKP